MNDSMIYMIIAVAALILIVIGMFFSRKSKPSKLLYAALMIIVLSMFFDERMIAYPLMGLGVILAIIDGVLKKK